MITFTMDKAALVAAFREKVWQLQNRHLKSAMTAAAKVLEDAYRHELADAHGAPKHKRKFLPAYTTVSRKVRVFKDGNGVWAIIGNEAGADGRSFSPQARFGEHGTEKRVTKAGQNRGRMPAYKWMAKASAKAMPAAVEAFWNKLKELHDRS